MWRVPRAYFSTRLLDKGHTPSTLKVYVAVIAANYSPEAGRTIGRNQLVVKFLRGARRLNPPCPKTVPTWDLSIAMTLKTTLLLALASVKRVGDLQALSVCAFYLEFGSSDCKAVLQPHSGYVPKVLTAPFRAQGISLLSLPTPDGEQGPPVRAMRVYFERSKFFRQSAQLFVCFGGSSKEKKTIPDSRGYRPGIYLSGRTVLYRCEGPLHERKGLLLGMVKQNLYWGDLCGRRVFVTVDLYQILQFGCPCPAGTGAICLVLLFSLRADKAHDKHIPDTL